MPEGVSFRPSRNLMADLVGPFYDGTRVAAYLDCRREDLGDSVGRGDLLGMQTSDATWVYPVFQFTSDRRVRPELIPLLRLFAGLYGWSLAVWLRTAMDELGDATPEHWLAEGGDPKLVHRLAGQTLAQWNT